MTEKEAKDIEKIQKFDKNIRRHEKTLTKSLAALEKFNDNTAGYKELILSSIKSIKEYIDEAKNNELKIAVAASKKSGKSVVVNSMIERELAPTSLELATPNNCIYKPSEDEKYKLHYNNEFHEFSEAEDLRKYVGELFKKAEGACAEGKSIPDMTIEYVTDKSGFSQYTIYDTPGPDRAGAPGHKEAAHRAMHEADVIVYTIDYTKHLTETEVDFLKDIKKIFNEDKKNYSLIISVNKLDQRYSSTGDKNTVRIMDFIKQELIKIAPEFSNAIVIGTSALTYFNCIAAPEIEGCDILLAPSNFKDALDECIDQYVGQDEMTILDQIGDMISKARRFHAMKIDNLEQLKQFSGMQNLLSYIKYVATTKARNEKVTNLIYKIEDEYQKIMNVFRFNELETAMIENKDKLDEAKKILSEFVSEVNGIFDDKYKDIFDAVTNDEEVSYKQKRYKSRIIRKIGKKYPISLDDIYNDFANSTKQDINIDAMLDELINKELPFKLKNKITALFNSDKIKRRTNRKTGDIIDVAPINDVKLIYDQVAGEKNIKTIINGFLRDKCSKLSNEFSDEYEKVSKDLENMLNNRINMLRRSIEKCEKALNEKCNLPFEIKAPEFSFAFKEVENKIVDTQYNIDISIGKALVTIDEKSLGKENKKAKSENALKKILQNISDAVLNNDDYISKENAISIYKDANLNAEICGLIKTSDVITDEFTRISDDLNKQTKDFTNKISYDATLTCNNAKEIAKQTRYLIDHTGEYKNRIEELKKERQVLNTLKKCISRFTESWEESSYVS